MASTAIAASPVATADRTTGRIRNPPGTDPTIPPICLPDVRRHRGMDPAAGVTQMERAVAYPGDLRGGKDRSVASEGAGQRRPLRPRHSAHSHSLEADMICAGGQVRAGRGGDRLGVSARDDGVDQPV
jgi:hypothetical protein